MNRTFTIIIILLLVGTVALWWHRRAKKQQQAIAQPKPAESSLGNITTAIRQPAGPDSVERARTNWNLV